MEGKGKKREMEVLILSSDEEDDQGLAEKNSSKVGRRRARASSSPVEIVEKKVRAAGPIPTRLEMEQERLARLANYSGSTAATPTIRCTTSRFMSFGQLLPSAASSSSTAQSTSSKSTPSSARYWKGAVKRTANQFDASPAGSLSFAEVVGETSLLTRAIVSAMQLNPDWVCPHFPASIPLLLIAKDERMAGVLPPNVTARIRPEKQYEGLYHMKYFILYYKDFIRICVVSANFEVWDWNYIENVMYIHDFPITKDLKPDHTDFSRSLAGLLNRPELQVPNAFRAPFEHFDFSSSKNVKLVITYPGTFSSWEQIERGGGMCGLATAVQALHLSGVSSGGRYEVEAQGSSLGNYTEAWLGQILGAVSGVHPKDYYRATSKSPHGIPSSSGKMALKIIYPTLAIIDASHGGRPGGGTLFCQEKFWNAGYDHSIKTMFHKAISKRQRVISHAKYILALHKTVENRQASSTFKHDGFLYLGSHNFTAAAWGRLSYPTRGEGKDQPRSTNGNYEMGVVIPLRADSEAELETMASDLVGYERPLEKYGAGDVPWMQFLHQ